MPAVPRVRVQALVLEPVRVLARQHPVLAPVPVRPRAVLARRRPVLAPVPAHPDISRRYPSL